MPKRATELSAQKVLKAAPGRYYDGDGLCLLIRNTDAAWWVYRFTRRGKTRDIGLGRARGKNAISLKAAREEAAKLRAIVRAGRDPLAEREAEAARKAADAASRIAFRGVAERYIQAHEAGWRNPKHRQQWQTTLRTYAFPAIADLPVGDVETGDVMAILEPIWREKPETASRVRGRIESIIDYATARGWRSGENPARWKGHLANLLPARAKVARVEHHAALPWQRINRVVARLREVGSVSARAVEFTILTAARSGEVRGATWAEIDFARSTWIVPANRMKGGREHRIPLSSRALEILREIAAFGSEPDAFIFPGGVAGRPLSDVALSRAAKSAAGDQSVTTHGFRSTFRDWLAESTNYPRELGEKALAHTLSDKVEAAYQRGDMIAKRARLMQDWTEFCSKPYAEPTGEVVPLRAGQ